MARDYYVVLGIARTESEAGVRSAFRELVRRRHPDRLGPGATDAFREVVEAYETLGDPARRRAYDESLRAERQRPLVRRASLGRDFAEIRPGAQAIMDRFAANFTAWSPPGQGVRALDVEVAVSSEEASRGARLDLGIPVFRACGRCLNGCVHCQGRGVVERERTVSVDLPPMSGAGTTFLMPLSHLGITNLHLRVRVRVENDRPPPAPEPDLKRSDA